MYPERKRHMRGTWIVFEQPVCYIRKHAPGKLEEKLANGEEVTAKVSDNKSESLIE